MKARRPIGLRRSLISAILAISLALLGIQLALQRYFVGYVSRIYQSNMESVMERVTDEVQTTFTNMNNAVRFIADHPNTLDYVLTEKPEQRYRKAFDYLRPIVQIATQNLGFDHVLVSDVTGSWYRFSGSLSNGSCQKIKDAFGGRWGISNMVLTLDGNAWFCTAQPIVSFHGYTPSDVGLVVALYDVNKTRTILSDFGSFEGLSIQLHDFGHVLVSNNPRLEGARVDTPEAAGEKMYSRNGVIIPNSLAVSMSIPRRMVFPQQTVLGITILSVGLFSLFSIVAVGFFVNRLIVRPFVQVTEGTRNLDEGDLCARLGKTGVAYVDTLVVGINRMLDRLEEYNRRVLAARQTVYESELNQQKIKMHLLKNQIDRHFLFNSLASVKSLADRGEIEKVGEVSSGIAQILRFASSPDEEVNLFDEMDIVQRYVKIQNIRFSDKFRLEIDVDDRLCDFRILKLLIQPLVENALIHGLESAPGDCLLFIRGMLGDKNIRIEVEDRGVGIPAARLAEIQKKLLLTLNGLDVGEGMDGIALVNIQKRISLAYGAGYGLTMDSEEGRYTRAALLLPAISDTGTRRQVAGSD